MFTYLAEFIGTSIFIFLGLGVNAGAKLNYSQFKNAGPLFILVGWGLAYSITALCFYQYSGAFFNPVIPFSLAITGRLSWTMVPGYILAELLGAFLGSLMMYLFYKDQFDATDNPEVILSVFCSSAAIANMGLNLWCEIILCFIFMFLFTVIITTTMNPVFYGIILVACAAGLGGVTQFAVNPASDLMGRVAHQILPIHNKKDSQWGYAIVPVLGSFVGAIFGALVAQLITGFPAVELYL